MTTSPSKPGRILAIDPCPRGFGFVVMESGEKLVDWRLKESRKAGDDAEEIRRNRTAHCLRQIAGLIEQYQPDLIVVEDILGQSRRGETAKDLILRIHELGSEHRVAMRGVRKSALRQTFEPFGVTTKQAIAQVVAGQFPELADRLPPPRNPWDGTDPRMAIFNAAAMALAIFTGKNGKGDPRAN